jgi:hypothetical protein
MSHLLYLGAIHKQTGKYVYPKIANKKDEYICPECNKDLILCKGERRAPYFRHKVDNVNPCHHYSHPSELQIHKDAKLLMKTLLERKIPISFIRNCSSCKKLEEFDIPEMSGTAAIQLEYRFEYNGPKIADVAYIYDGEILCIFEIYNTHKTCSENRPEPWFEVGAEALIELANDINLSKLQIPCIRVEKCDECVEKSKIKTRVENVPMKIVFEAPTIESLKNKSQIDRDIKISYLIKNNIIIDNYEDLKNQANYYYLHITHPISKQKLTYHTKRGEVDCKDIKYIHLISIGYSTDDIIEWYNSLTDYFKICKSCQTILSKNRQNELYCNNGDCSKGIEKAKIRSAIEDSKLKQSSMSTFLYDRFLVGYHKKSAKK